MPIGINGTVYGDAPGGNSVWNLNQREQGTLVQDNTDDAIAKLANDLNLKLDDTTKDYLVQHTLNEHSAENAWKREMEASNTQYQRAMEDIRRAGLNPFLAIQSLSGSSPSSNAQSVTGGLYTSRKNQQEQNTKDIAGKVMTVLGIIAAAVIGAML